MLPGTPRIRFEMPAIPGGAEFLTALSDLLGAPGLGQDGALRIPSLRPEGAGPDIELCLSQQAQPRLRFVTNEGPSGPALPFCFDSSDHVISCAGDVLPLAPGVLAEVVSIAEVIEELDGCVQSVDHLGLNLPQTTHPRPAWISGLHAAAAQCRVMPYDAEAEIAFIVPTTPEERGHAIANPDAPHKPKLELVRDDFLTLPMLGFTLDTQLSLDELCARFPPPRGVARPGNETFFRSLVLAHPWPSLLISLDLSPPSTSSIEITRLLVDGGAEVPPESAGALDV